MTTIQDRIEAKLEEAIHDPTGKLGEELRALAVDAIYAGQGTEAWRNFMKTFAGTPEDPAQLARLTAVNDPGCPASPYIREARAYLIANITCGTPTFTGTTRGVEDRLDKTLPAPPPNP
jgi:hypothetical protein